jgi:hypothetical protein
MFYKKEVDHIGKSVREIVKHKGFLLKAKDENFNNDIFYTLPGNPSKLISIKILKIPRCRLW